MAFPQVLLFFILVMICSATELNISSPKIADHFPAGHPAHCMILLGGIDRSLLRLEALPGVGWDNLLNKEMGTVVQHSYHQCKTTEDGRFLIPDGITIIPVKSSKVDSVAEYFDHWDSYTSVSATSINVQVGVLGLPIGGKFSSEYKSIKTKQQFERSVTTRMQLRYIKYTARVNDGQRMDSSFLGQLRRIGAHLMLNRTRLAAYESQVLVRDYGTHIVKNIDIGAALVKVDQLKYESSESTDTERQRIAISAAAVVFFEEVGIQASAKFSESSSGSSAQDYKSSRSSSQLSTYGGKNFKPSGFTAENWSESIENNLVTLDRTGDPIYMYINEETLPDLPQYMVEKVHNLVKNAVRQYYKHNIYRGCTNPSAPNFSFQANVNDGKCQKPKSSFTFGGVYQTCSGTGFRDLCDGMLQKNPLSGDYSCPDNYEPVLIKSGTKSAQQVQTKTNKCGFLHLKRCASREIDTASANYNAYWCAAKGNTSASGGYMFGGLYTQHTDNIVTQTSGCPTYFSSLKILDDLYICVSDDYELGTQYLLPFAGFFSCASGNPLAIDANKRVSVSVDSYPRNCPYGYSQHLAIVEDGCEVEYCIKSGAITTGHLPRIRKPPFMTRPLDIPRDVDDAPITVFSSDGSLWTTMEELKPSKDLTPENNTLTLTAIDGTILDIPNVKPAATANFTKLLTKSESKNGENNGKEMRVSDVADSRYTTNTDSVNLQKENNENEMQISGVAIAVISSTGTLLCVLLIVISMFVIKWYRGPTSVYQKI